MKMPKRLITSLGVVLLSVSALAQAGPGDQRDDRNDYDRGGRPQQQQPQHQERGQGGDNWRRPPQDFGPVRQMIRDDHEHFTRGAPPPRDIRIVRGQPLPHGYYGERLDGRALSRLPVYRGYEWRRTGADIVLIAVGTGIVYEVLDGVLY